MHPARPADNCHIGPAKPSLHPFGKSLKCKNECSLAMWLFGNSTMLSDSNSGLAGHTRARYHKAAVQKREHAYASKADAAPEQQCCQERRKAI